MSLDTPCWREQGRISRVIAVFGDHQLSALALRQLRIRKLNPPEPKSENLNEYAQRIKSVDRHLLNQLDACQAQAEVDAVLAALPWTVSDREKLVWHGDLGDEAELPDWMNEP